MLGNGYSPWVWDGDGSRKELKLHPQHVFFDNNGGHLELDNTSVLAFCDLQSENSVAVVGHRLARLSSKSEKLYITLTPTLILTLTLILTPTLTLLPTLILTPILTLILIPALILTPIPTLILIPAQILTLILTSTLILL